MGLSEVLSVSLSGLLGLLGLLDGNGGVDGVHNSDNSTINSSGIISPILTIYTYQPLPVHNTYPYTHHEYMIVIHQDTIERERKKERDRERERERERDLI